VTQTPIARPANLWARLRVPYRLLRVAAATGRWVGAWLLLAPMQAGPGGRARWRRHCMQGWCRSMCRALGVVVRVDGPQPASPRFLVSNHLGYLDIVVLGSLLPAAFVSRADVAGWPVIGPLARWFDTVFLARERKRDLPEVNEQVAARLADGGAIVLFPEGTSTAGEAVQAFRPSLLAPAAAAAVPVHAACLRYGTTLPDAPASLAACWWGDAAFLPHALTLLSLRRIDAEVQFATAPRCSSDRKELAAALQRDVEGLFVPVT
jgi:1-acyl-sn-glycerol-3-phosphate acyltransferase